jgi:hypothetical protein
LNSVEAKIATGERPPSTPSDAVEDLVKIIAAYQFDSHVERVSDDEISKPKKHYTARRPQRP